MNKSAFTVEDDIRRMQDEVFQLRLEHVILVEGKSDVRFWEHILEQVIAHRFKIYSYVNFPTQNTSGKRTLTRYYLPFASRGMVFCLDSDYDYLLDNQNLKRPFVFQTYVYSVENYFCYAPSLARILTIGTRVAQAEFNFEQFFSRYAVSVYDWLVCQLFDKHTNGTEPAPPPVFSTITEPEEDLGALAQQISLQIAPQLSILKDNTGFEDFIGQLAESGLTTQNAYLFIRGHDLLEKVTLKLLKRVAEPIIEQEFSNLSNEGKAEYTAYQKQTTFEKLLYQNLNIINCPFYERIRADIQLAFETQ